MMLDHWMLKNFEPGEGHADDNSSDWLPVAAPGDTYLALHAAGRIPHPFAAENEAACAWIKDREWCWRVAFEMPPAAAGERLILVFEGLDTFAGIWLNGVEIGASDNMFLASRFDITDRLRTDVPNQLVVRFTPPALVVADKQMATWDIISDPIKTSKRNFIRKAQYGWGWDWGPSLPTVGIWKPVRIERQRVAAIADVRFETLAIGERARIAVTVDIDVFAAQPVVATIALADPDGSVVATATLATAARQEFTIDAPRLWWTPELGEAALYTLSVTLQAGDDVIDQHTQKVGIRTVQLDTSDDPDEPGSTFFRFILNDVPIFARGANWIPPSSFIGAVTPAAYADLVGKAAAANMNMLRIWGGGIYEHDAFYNECDRLGILVWQDFMFACAPYPEHDAAFVDSVRAEVSQQIKRLRSRACLALWCGENEGQAVQQFMNRLTGQQTRYSGVLYFEDIIPGVLAVLDPTTPYWQGSPWGGPSPNSMRGGDVHNWTVWHGLPGTPNDAPVGTFDHSPAGVAYTRYAEDMSRFVSEFGIQAAPALSTLARWMAPETMTLGSDGFLNRIKDRPKDKVDAMLIPVTGLPTTLAEYVDYTQIVQAEGLKFGIEHYRRRKPHCSGTLLWQYNDCWPGVSWSLIDSDGVAKPSWYAVQRAYAPVLASFKALDDGSVELWVTNDTLSALAIDAMVDLATFTGVTVSQENVIATVAANASVAVWRGRPEGSSDRVLTVRAAQFADNRHFFAAVKDLALEPRSLDVSVAEVVGGALAVTLSATSYVYGVRLSCVEPDAVFSDNCFDMRAGETRTINLSSHGTALKSDDVSAGPMFE